MLKVNDSKSLITGRESSSDFSEMFKSKFKDFFKESYGHDKQTVLNNQAIVDRDDFFTDVFEEISRRYHERDKVDKTDERTFNCFNMVLGGPGKLQIEYNTIRCWEILCTGEYGFNLQVRI